MFSIFTGCAAKYAVFGYSYDLNKFDNNLLNNECDYDTIDAKIDGGDDILLWSEQGGSLARACGDYKLSNQYFDISESYHKYNTDLDTFAQETFETTAQMLVNENINDYEGRGYELIMVNTYKALNFASLGDWQNARVELNRALERQERAKQYFQEELLAKKQALQSQHNNQNTIVNNPRNQSAINKIYSNLDEFTAYPDFINPFTTYFAGVYFMNIGDYEKAENLLKNSVGMNADNPLITADWELSQRLKKGSEEKHIWVIYENGLSMRKDQKKIHLPLFVFTNSNVLYTGTAFPTIHQRAQSHPYITANNQKTVQIASMDRVIKTEFKKRLPMIIARKITSDIIKTVTQAAVYNAGNGSDTEEFFKIAGISTSIYQAATNNVDVRIWSSLPKNWQATRIPNTGEEIVIKDNKNNIIKNYKILKDKNAIIYIRSGVPSNNNTHLIVF